ncbi:MAG: NHL repeat-containing protein, partial [Chloroflexota bacterium]
MEVSSELRYELVKGWEKAPSGHSRLDVCGVAVDSRDRIYVLTRPAQLLVYEPDGTVVTTWPAGLFTNQVHGITIGPDDSVYIADAGDHTVRKFAQDHRLLMTLGNPGVPSDTGYDAKMGFASIVRAGAPFNTPTNTAVAANGDVYVTDGYGNARVHRFSHDGKLIQSWGAPGTGPGQFNWPHDVAVTSDGKVLVG